ncbi:MAG: PEP-CTERM sorting domain-containing protein [Gammaproteobacteria bacterium]|nr:PEP-CTERM sorting domain-containing protein [Gammaproteobacteria bacterium]
MMKNFIRGAGLLLLAMGSSAVMAVPITGNIAFYGTSTVAGEVVTFTGNSATVASVDGDFAAEGVVARGPLDPATALNTAVFNPLDYSTPFAGVSPLWTIGGFSFDLETIVVGPTGPGVDLALSGTGTLMRAGYDNTAYNWAYSGNSIGGGTLQVFSSASAPTPTQVPEPGSLALLGLGLVGFAVTGYKRRRTQA